MAEELTTSAGSASPGSPPPSTPKPYRVSMMEKLSSRTFLLTVIWTLFVPAAIVVKMFFPDLVVPLESVITLSGTIALAYVGGEKARDTFALRSRPTDPPV